VYLSWTNFCSRTAQVGIFSASIAAAIIIKHFQDECQTWLSNGHVHSSMLTKYTIYGWTCREAINFMCRARSWSITFRGPSPPESACINYKTNQKSLAQCLSYYGNCCCSNLFWCKTCNWALTTGGETILRAELRTKTLAHHGQSINSRFSLVKTTTTIYGQLQKLHNGAPYGWQESSMEIIQSLFVLQYHP